MGLPPAPFDGGVSGPKLCNRANSAASVCGVADAPTLSLGVVEDAAGVGCLLLVLFGGGGGVAAAIFAPHTDLMTNNNNNKIRSGE